MAGYGTARGLPRYDSNTLQPIRQRPYLNGHLGTATSTLKTYTRRPLHSDLYTLPREPVQPLGLTLDAFDRPGSVATVHSARGALYTSSGQTLGRVRSPVLSAPLSPLGELPPLQRHAFKWSWPERLHDNYALGLHRLFFLARRPVALAALAVTVWLFFGRHRAAGFPLSAQERNLSLLLFSTSLLALFGTLVGGGNHHERWRRAQQHTWLRLAFLALGLLLELACAVLAVVALVHVSKQTDPEDLDKTKQFPVNARLTQVGAQLGLSLLLVLLGLASLYHGVGALLRLFRDRRTEHDTYRLNIEHASYGNPLMVDQF